MSPAGGSYIALPLCPVTPPLPPTALPHCDHPINAPSPPPGQPPRNAPRGLLPPVHPQPHPLQPHGGGVVPLPAQPDQSGAAVLPPHLLRVGHRAVGGRRQPREGLPEQAEGAVWEGAHVDRRVRSGPRGGETPRSNCSVNTLHRFWHPSWSPTTLAHCRGGRAMVVVFDKWGFQIVCIHVHLWVIAILCGPSLSIGQCLFANQHHSRRKA